MTQIRTMHPYGFRNGEWAKLVAMTVVDGRQCYVVVFPQDSKMDYWVVSDASGQYEFRETK